MNGGSFLAIHDVVNSVMQGRLDWMLGQSMVTQKPLTLGGGRGNELAGGVESVWPAYARLMWQFHDEAGNVPVWMDRDRRVLSFKRFTLYFVTYPNMTVECCSPAVSTSRYLYYILLFSFHPIYILLMLVKYIYIHISTSRIVPVTLGT